MLVTQRVPGGWKLCEVVHIQQHCYTIRSNRGTSQRSDPKLAAMIAKKPLLPIKQQRLFHTRALVTFPRNATIVRVQAADGIGILLPEPLVYAKALATVIARRASELALDFASEVSGSSSS